MLGVLFAYKIVFPIGLKFLWNYTIKMGALPDWTISYYMNFVTSFLVAFGIAFQFPIVIMMLAKFHIVTPKNLVNKRRHAIVIIFILAALLTPPDIISQLLLGIPMIALYEISILLAKIIIKQK